jgi:hypothetical protein
LNLACWFWRRRFFKNFNVFLLFCYYLPLEKGYPLHLKKFKSPLPKDDLRQAELSKSVGPVGLADKNSSGPISCLKLSVQMTD